MANKILAWDIRRTVVPSLFNEDPPTFFEIFNIERPKEVYQPAIEKAKKLGNNI